MPVESKPLFHPEVIRQRLSHFALPPAVEDSRQRLRHWADLIASGRADAPKETELFPDFLTDIFVNLLGYTRPAQSPDFHTLSRETHVVVDGHQVDAVLGRFRPDGQEYVVAVEGKGTRDPLEIPFDGRRMSAVDQCYRYAINHPTEVKTSAAASSPSPPPASRPCARNTPTPSNPPATYPPKPSASSAPSPTSSTKPTP